MFVGYTIGLVRRDRGASARASRSDLHVSFRDPSNRPVNYYDGARSYKIIGVGTVSTIVADPTDRLESAA